MESAPEITIPTAAPAESPATKQQRLINKDPSEDAWLHVPDNPEIDRNGLDSLRRILLNPDLPDIRLLHCHCGREVHRDDSWYVMGLDGRLICNWCARCNCCGREAMPNCRRVLCIDGMAMCYWCVKYFGYKKYPKLDIKAMAVRRKNITIAEEEPPPQAQQQQEEDDELDNASNSEYYDYNVPREDRSRFATREDHRHCLRRRFYHSPNRRLPKQDDPLRVPPEYLAENSKQRAMLCPACNSMALGPASYVVPSMARVYHRRCFKCCNCKDNLACGWKLPALDFHYCSCEAPLVWCARPACAAARLLHHRVTKCRLGCVRPGGRCQMDSLKQPPGTSSGLAKRRRKNKQQLLSRAVATECSPGIEQRQ